MHKTSDSADRVLVPYDYQLEEWIAFWLDAVTEAAGDRVGPHGPWAALDAVARISAAICGMQPEDAIEHLLEHYPHE